MTNAAIGQLDPTLLLNGIYELRVVVRDTLGQTTTSDLTTVIVDRKMKIGSFNLSFTDLTVPLPGLPLEVLRSYDSRDKSLGDFGIGWRLARSDEKRDVCSSRGLVVKPIRLFTMT